MLFLSIDAVGGPESGALPITYAVTTESVNSGELINGFSVLKTPNKAGALLEGNFEPGDRVVILEDVISTAGSAINAVKIAIESGLEVPIVVCILDRQMGGREAVEKMGIKFEALFTHQDFQELL